MDKLCRLQIFIIKIKKFILTKINLALKYIFMELKNIRELFLATGNKHKLFEMQSILPQIKIQTPADLNIAFNPDESGKTFFENALIKARSLYEVVKVPVLADDSGLCVQTLNGAPGIYSARYAVYHADDKPQDKKNIEKLLAELGQSKDRAAYFVCCLVLYVQPDRFFAVQEICTGEILEAARGENGFGYDPIFFIPELGKTMAELSDAEKNAVSHRGKALNALKKLFDDYVD